MDLTPKKRSKIVILNEHTNMTQRDIARVCEVSLGLSLIHISSVSLYICRIQLHKPIIIYVTCITYFDLAKTVIKERFVQ